MKPRQAYYAIRAAIVRRQDLRYKGAVPATHDDFPGGPYASFCYIATKAFIHFVPEAEAWCNENGSHYWNVLDGAIIDLTAEQFPAEMLPAIYAEGRRTRFKLDLCKRSHELVIETERGDRLTSAA